MRMSPVFVEMGGPDVVYGTLPKLLGLWASTEVGFTLIQCLWVVVLIWVVVISRFLKFFQFHLYNICFM